jgi:hypothetical protein
MSQVSLPRAVEAGTREEVEWLHGCSFIVREILPKVGEHKCGSALSFLASYLAFRLFIFSKHFAFLEAVHITEQNFLVCTSICGTSLV